MDIQKRRNRPAKTLKTFRSLHKWLASALFILFLIISITGLMLGWKKNSGGLLQADVVQGSTGDLKEWLSLDSLQVCAIEAIKREKGASFPAKVDRIDVRPDKGTVRFLLKSGFLAVQVDGASGKVLSVEKRTSDFIEQLHDGSILDRWMKTRGNVIKLGFTSTAGLGLLLFTVTGFWMRFGPEWIRRRRKERSDNP